jgi:mono/diheme cytochrome c family protein
MSKNFFVAALAVAVAAGIGYANQAASSKVVIPVRTTSAANGQQMYVNYCAPCHGVDGRGHGPVTAALIKQPADLTLLSKNNRGKFPSARVRTVLQFGIANPSHGTAQMPVWGPILSGMEKTYSEPNLQALRISNLIQYLETLQSK